ncbi:MAG: hypothetical protein WC121_05160 [Candidatus Kapaibacterium sp.]
MFIPFKKENITLDNKINFIILFFVFFFLIGIYESYELFSYYFDKRQSLDSGFYLTFISLLIPLITIYLLLKKNKIGWILAVSYSLFNLNSILVTLVYYIYYKITTPVKLEMDFFDYLDNYILFINPYTHFLQMLFYALLIWTMTRMDIREFYGIDTKTSKLILLLVGGVTLSILTYFRLMVI